MMNFRKAREAFADVRRQLGRAEKDPSAWDISLGLEGLVTELDQRLTDIEQNQRQILQELQRKR